MKTWPSITRNLYILCIPPLVMYKINKYSFLHMNCIAPQLFVIISIFTYRLHSIITYIQLFTLYNFAFAFYLYTYAPDNKEFQLKFELEKEKKNKKKKKTVLEWFRDQFINFCTIFWSLKEIMWLNLHSGLFLQRYRYPKLLRPCSLSSIIVIMPTKIPQNTFGHLIQKAHHRSMIVCSIITLAFFFFSF